LTADGAVAAAPHSFLEHRDLARAISAVENRYALPGVVAAQFDAACARPRPARPAFVIGITGPPGAGKSTVTDRLIAGFRAGGDSVAVIAVDPSSPFTHGAVLGDRVRMQQHSGDAGVYIRSMASREAGGGLAPASREAVQLCDRAGFDVVIVETVGVGQVELEIVALADTIVVVTVPGLGDAVQSIKAGLTEIADIFVVNMADRPGANATAIDLVHMIRESGREVPVLKTIGIDGTGIPEFLNALGAARAGAGPNAERALRFDTLRRARDRAVRRAATLLDRPEAAAIFTKLKAREIDREAARAHLDAYLERSWNDAD
jgi:LAO/AO transport system kinase